MRWEPGGPIDVGNAGTLMRLLPGWLASQEGRIFVLDGDSSIRRRPVDRIAQPLALMGAQIEAKDGRFPPFVVYGTPLRAITYELPVASAQVKSCVLLAGLGADGTTSVVEPAPSRDHTERMLAGAGVLVQRDGLTVSVTLSGGELEAQNIVVPGDLSSAAFLIAAGVLVRGSQLVVRDVGVNWTRTGFLRILERMGALVVGELEAPSAAVAVSEPICDLEVRAGPLGRHGRRGRGGPAGDRRAAARRAARLLRRGRDGRARGAGAARQGVRPDRRRRRRPARPRRDDRGDRRRLRGHGARAACAAARSTPAAITAWRCSAPSRAWHRREGVEVVGMDAAAVSYPGLRGRPGAAGVGVAPARGVSNTTRIATAIRHTPDPPPAPSSPQTSSSSMPFTAPAPTPSHRANHRLLSSSRC